MEMPRVKFSDRHSARRQDGVKGFYGAAANRSGCSGNIDGSLPLPRLK